MDLFFSDLNKTILSHFSESILQSIQWTHYTHSVEADSLILEEGTRLEHLWIPIDSEVLLVSNYGTDSAEQISQLQPGRCFNLTNYLKSGSATFSLVSRQPTRILKIPRDIVDSLFSKQPSVKLYLSRITENPSYHRILRDFETIGLQPSFIFEFVTEMIDMHVEAHEAVESAGQNPKALHFLSRGSFIIEPQQGQNSWLAPLHTWFGWHEIIESLKLDATLQAKSESEILLMPIAKLRDLQARHPKCFSTLDRWIDRGELTPLTEPEQDLQVDDVRTLFERSKGKKKSRFGYPSILQNETMDCAPACLSMVSEYFGKELSVQFWRSKLSTNMSGTTMLDMAKTAEKYGFISHCLEVGDLQELDPFLLPFITLRKHHYSVVYEINKQSVVFGDPSYGIRQLSIEEFEQGRLPVGLFLKPNIDFEKIPPTRSRWLHYAALFSGLKRDIFLAAACGVIGVILALFPPIMTQILLDDVLVQKNTEVFSVIIVCLVLSTLLSSFVSWAESYYLNFIMIKFNFRAASLFVQKMLSLPYNFFATRHVGDFTHRLDELSHLRNFVTSTLLRVSLNLMTLFIFGGALFLINAKLAFWVFLLSPLIMLVPLLFSQKLSRIYGEIFTQASEQTSLLTDYVKGMSVIKSMSAEFTSRLRFESKLLELVQSQKRFAMTALGIETFTTGYHQLANALIMVLSVYLCLQGEMTAGQVVAFTMLTVRFFQPLFQITKQWDQFIEIKSVLSRLNDIFLANSEEHPSEAPVVASSASRDKKEFLGEIEFRDVWFRYGGETTDWVLQGLNFKIEPGQKVSIVGASGSGKSTIANLLTRLYEPVEGQIFIDGKDYREYDIEWLRSEIGLLHQESFLFSGTIADNIALNSLNASHADMCLAAEKAAALPFIMKKPDGLSCYVPHGGHGFSGGEKQRISLARMFFQKPSIVLLDEATSALDGINEAEVMSSLKETMSHRTVISITHRYSTVINSDFVLVLSEGKVAGFGSLAYVREKNHVFKKLFKNSSPTELDFT